MCDIIYVMKEGRVLERGTHQQLMESGNDYANIVNTYYRRPPGKGVSPSSSSSSFLWISGPCTDRFYYPCASVGAGGLVVEYRIRNFHVASGNLALGSCKQP